MKLRTIIVDDEQLAIMVLENHLSNIPHIELIKSYSDPVEAYKELQDIEVDLLILDIEMPKLTGVDLVKTLHNPPLVIFITANKNYAVEGFELNAVDYVVKPVTFDRLNQAVERAIQDYSSNKNLQLAKDKPGYLFLKENKKNVKVYFENILYLESQKDYVKVVTKLKTVLTKQKLIYFEEILDSNKFLRIHRSFVVSIDNIDAYSASSVEINGIEVPIGRNYKDEVIERLDSFGSM